MKFLGALLAGTCFVLVAWGIFELLDVLVRATARIILLRTWRKKGRTKEWRSLLAEEKHGAIIVNHSKSVFWGMKYWWVTETNNQPTRDRRSDLIDRWQDGEGYIIQGIEDPDDVEKQSVFLAINYEEIWPRR